MPYDSRAPSAAATAVLPTAPRALPKVLGAADGAALVIGTSIGVGIYATPRIIAGYLGTFPLVISLWLAVGLFVLIGCFIYAELGTRLPETGGEYVYLSRALGPFAGFMFGWAQLFIIRTGATAGVALIAADYLGYFVKLSAAGRIVSALLLVAGLGAINWLGVTRASTFQKAATAVKVLGIVALIVAGLVLVGRQDDAAGVTGAREHAAVSPANLAAAVMMIFFSYSGWTRLGYVAGEMKDPRRTIPFSLFIGIGTVIAVNCLMNVLYFRVLGMQGIAASTALASDTAMRIMGPTGARVVAALVVVSAVGTMNGTVMSASRCYYAMAHDGVLFGWLDYVSPRFLTPARAILAHCLWSAVLILVRKEFQVIVASRVFANLIYYGAATLALFRLRRKGVGAQRSYRSPFYPVLPALFLACLAGFIAFRIIFAWYDSLVDLAFILSGLPFWLKWGRSPISLPTGSALHEVPSRK
jgi:APA family basic amino acid/polyamine antiporter